MKERWKSIAIPILVVVLFTFSFGDGVTAQSCSAKTDAEQGICFDLYDMDHGCKPTPCHDLCVANYPTLDDSCCFDANTCRCIYICR
ncbi:hypothetical protein MRB53_015443 [Persea americana]|uniref:Uncharacterized protein n=1 Tax=Persea americana TaxID=3435 RepID=A0ACC2KDN9_PERAE|nr:hypothetical protein MRB53_015443 [Persea americana]